jgi:CheY-like chemotaxis protein
MLDLNMPKIGGLEVLKEIRAEPSLRRIPVVVFTSSREERDVVESYELGVNAYLVKPVEFDQFTEAVKQLGLFWLLLNEPSPQ